MTNTELEYVGDELDLFSGAQNWKRYWSRAIAPHLGRNVLDVGAGIGATARLLAGGDVERWLALEPDPSLAARMSEDRASGRLPAHCEIRVGVVADLAETELFDTALYIDVLEHIDDDRAELQQVSRHLTAGGNLIVLSPAHQWLFTPFDTALGHFRRYSRRTLTEAGPEGMELVRLIYIDAVGVLASAANRMLLKSAHPTRSQIMMWDRLMVPVSRAIDPLTGRKIGKSIIGVWRKPT